MYLIETKQAKPNRHNVKIIPVKLTATGFHLEDFNSILKNLNLNKYIKQDIGIWKKDEINQILPAILLYNKF